MARRALNGAVTGGVIAGLGALVVSSYRRDLATACARLAGVDRRVITTELGAVECAERGDGPPLLVVHGIFQGCDGALLAARDMVAGRRIIAPSRFGYLGSAMPPRATPARQADAFAALLDELGIDRLDVLAISAGSTSALQLALRHPGRVRRLAIVSGNWPGSPTATVQPALARIIYADPPLWALSVLAPTLLARVMGVPEGFPRTADDAAFISEFSESIFPIGPRAGGAWFDATVSNADVNEYRLEDMRVPTLVLHAADDPLASYDAARRAAERIPGATFVRVESGGHLLLGQGEEVRGALATFLATPATGAAAARHHTG